MLEAKIADTLMEKLAKDFAGGATKVEITNKSFINYNCINVLKKNGFKIVVKSYPSLRMTIA